VPVAQRRAQAMLEMSRLRKKGLDVQPVRVDGRQIARTFWGQAWCEHLEKFSDFENRLPRGRTYVRNGSVCHLGIGKGKIVAKVSGSELYDVEIKIRGLPEAKWTGIKRSCAGRVGTLLELLQGRLSKEVMQVVADRDNGLFPLPREISLDCSCPDWAEMCKHVAAVLYGVGARLDEKPELLFLLRGVDQAELVGEDAGRAVVSKAPQPTTRVLSADRVSEVFGIDMDAGPVPKARNQRAGTVPVRKSGRPDRPSHAKPSGHGKPKAVDVAREKKKVKAGITNGRAGRTP
jgi:uncharacterized Zn finger protein